MLLLPSHNTFITHKIKSIFVKNIAFLLAKFLNFEDATLMSNSLSIPTLIFSSAI